MSWSVLENPAACASGFKVADVSRFSDVDGASDSALATITEML
jgi:hypothetical protein